MKMKDETRWRVDLPSGYISVASEEKARDIYAERGDAIRIRKCRNIFDNGIVVKGLPIFVDLTVDRTSGRN